MNKRTPSGDYSQAPTLYNFLTAHLARIQAVHHPGMTITPANVDGWHGPYCHPLCTDGRPSLWLRPDGRGDPGAYHDTITGEAGTLAQLAAALGVNPRLHLIPEDRRHKRPRTTRVAQRRIWAAVRDLLTDKGGAA